MPTSADKFSAGYAGKKKPKKAEVAGPYRSQSSNPKIRSEATPTEHRSEPTTVRGANRKTRKTRTRKPPRPAKVKAVVPKLKGIKIDTPVDPSTAYQQAKYHGTVPSQELKEKYGSKAFKRAEKARMQYVGEREGIHSDPAAEFVIGSLATAGLGGVAAGGAKLLGKLGAREAESVLAKGGAQIASKEASGASTAAQKTGSKIVAKVKAAPAKKVRAVKTAPRRAAKRVKETPQRVRTAPARAKKAATTKEGRRAAAGGGARRAARHPVGSGTGAAAISPVPLPGELDKRANAFVKGTAAAVVNHPKETLAQTGKGVLGFLTSPLAIAGAGVSSVKQGSPAPLVATGKTLAEGTAHMVGNLASGDPNKVEQTTLKETGLTPFIPVPHVIRGVRRSEGFGELRGGIRSRVENRRAGTREGRAAARTRDSEAGKFVGKRQLRKKPIRHSVADTSRPGQNYVLRRTGELIERQRSRSGISRFVTRMGEKGTYWGKHSGREIRKELKKSKLTDRSDQNAGDALRIIVKYGVPKDEIAGLAHVKEIHDSYPNIDKGVKPPEGVHLDRHSTQWILDHPELFHDEHFWKAVDAFERQAEEVGVSERNRYLASANSVVNPRRVAEGKAPVLLPEERISQLAERYLPQRDHAYSRKEALDIGLEREALIKDLKSGRGNQAKIAALEAEQKGLMESMAGLMKPPEHGGAEHGISTTRAEAYTPEMLNGFVNDMKRAHAEMGLRTPAAYVADQVPSSLGPGDKAPDFAQYVPATKVWPSQGKAAMSGNAESGFEHLQRHSIEGPRARRAVNHGLAEIFEKFKRPVNGKAVLTKGEVEHLIATHQLDQSRVLMVRTQFLNSALDGEFTLNPERFQQVLDDEVAHAQKMAEGSTQLRDELHAGSKLKGEKFVPMDAVAIHELMGHFQPLGKVSDWASKGSNFATRTILNSPAFALIQIPQEGLPLAAALGRNIVHVPKAIANLRRISKLPPEMLAEFRSNVGSSVGVLGAPARRELRSEPRALANPIRAAGPYPKWRHAWNIINGNTLGKFDRGRAGIFREIAADAKIHGDLKRAQKGFNRWRRGANNLFKGEEAAVKAMQGMTRAERDAYVAAHPRLGDKLMTAMNDMAGNWNSFTVFEKHFAPLTIFYPFQRYSVNWMLYHFPLDHPVVATAMAMLGQVNAQELEKIAKTKGSVPSVLDYTMPVIQNGPGKEPTILPAGQRTFPGLSTVQTAAVTGKPTQLIGEVSPLLSIAASASQGIDAYTGRPIEGESGWEYMARQLAALSPAGRLAGVNTLGQDESTASKTYGAQDPLRPYRSTLDPFIGQTAAQFAETKKLNRDFKDKYADPVPELSDNPEINEAIYGVNGRGGWVNGDKRPLEKLVREHKISERASDRLSAAEKPYLPKNQRLTKRQEKLRNEAYELIQGGILIPTEQKPKVKLKGGGIGGGSGSGIGGHPIGGSIGGPIGGSTGGGGIGGYPIGGG